MFETQQDLMHAAGFLFFGSLSHYIPKRFFFFGNKLKIVDHTLGPNKLEIWFSINKNRSVDKLIKKNGWLTVLMKFFFFRRNTME